MSAIVFLPLTQGQVAVIDFADMEEFGRRKWHALWNPRSNTFYALRKEGWGHVWLHCELLNTKGVDHRDGDGLNNQRANLRPATHAQNMRNRVKRAAATSKFKGVYWCPDARKWRANLQVAGRRIYLGKFHREEDAARSYDAGARAYFGEFAKPNFP